MSDQYVGVVVIPTGERWNGYDTTPVNMIEVQFTPTKEAEVRHRVCPTCRFTFPETEMMNVSGAYFCIRFKHGEDEIAEANSRKS